MTLSPAPRADRFAQALAEHGLPPLRRRLPTTLQVNLGKYCNQTCRHCHVDAGPLRTERMDGRVAGRVLEVLRKNPSLAALDLTGGAPELNPNFRSLAAGGRALGREVSVRCNLTVLLVPGQEDTPRFFAEHRLVVIASLPCYTAANTDRQRGEGVFERSLEALRRLNALGYGTGEPRGLKLHLVYNPGGPTLPGPQAALEADYHRQLREDFGVVFDRLFTIANMPIHRFADDLRAQGLLEDYEDLLARSFNAAAADAVMCRDLLSVDWDGRLSDCDFNQMLGLPLGAGARTLFDLDATAGLQDAPIATDEHCLGCTAGQGSGCGGALSGGGS